MNILVKYATKGNPILFLETLEGYIKKAKDNSRIKYIVTVDKEDLDDYNIFLKRATGLSNNVIIRIGDRTTKVEAINIDIDSINWQWDILVVISDSLQANAYGWDQYIEEGMKEHFPNTDGCLWFDEADQKITCKLPVIGKCFYDRFGFVFNKKYNSFFHDSEFTDIALDMNKIVMINNRIIKKEVIAKNTFDEKDIHWNEDRLTYAMRKKSSFLLL